MVRAVLPALLLFAAAGCSPSPQTAGGRAEATTVASCRASTNQAFNRQNRYLLSERDQTANPFSTSGDTGITSAGLAQRYDFENQLASCLSASGAPDRAAAPSIATPASGATSSTLSR